MLTTPGTNRQDTQLRSVGYRRWWPVFALAAVARLLRLWHIAHGLPDFTEEAIPFREALKMWGWQTGHTDFNPHFFHYPTLTIYIHFALQKFHYALGLISGRYLVPADFWLAVQHQPTLPVVLARLVTVAADVAAVIAVWSLAERLRPGAGWIAGALMVFAAPLVATSRLIFVDPVQAVLSIWAVERMVTYQDNGRRSSLMAAVILVGLAASAKYNAGLLVLPLGWALWSRGGWHALTRWPLAAGAAVLVFLATSPYVLLDFNTFRADFAFERRHMIEGHLGTLGTAGAGFLLETALRQLGPGALLLLAGRLATLPWRWRSGAGRRETTLWLALIPAIASVAFFRMTAIRYLVPLIPFAAVLIALAALSVVDKLTAKTDWRWRLAAALTLTVVLAPVVVSGVRTAASGADTTRSQAVRWCEAHLTADDLILQETYGAPLRTFFDTQQAVLHPAFAAASEPAQRRFLAARHFRSVPLPMAASGRFTVDLAYSSGTDHRLLIFPHAPDLNQVFYEPALLRGIDYFVQSSGVSRRYERDPERYRPQKQLYDLLATRAEVAASFQPHDNVGGPTITVYRLGDGFQTALSRQYAYLDPYWWAAAVPLKYRLEAERLLDPEQSSRGSVRKPDGRPATWVLPLERLFDQQIAPFLLRTAHYYAELGRHDDAVRNAGCVLAMTPTSLPANLIYARSQAHRDRLDIAIAVLENGIRARRAGGLSVAQVRLELAVMQQRAGDLPAARAELNGLLAEEPDASVATRARDLLARIRHESAGPVGR